MGVHRGICIRRFTIGFASVVEDGYQETLLQVIKDTAEKLGK